MCVIVHVDVTMSQLIRLESFSKCDFIPVDYYDARHVKSSFKKLMRACVPSGPFTDPDKGFLHAVEESEWMKQLQCILQIAGAIVDLLDIQHSSVMLCLEDGWDFTTQVVMPRCSVFCDPFVSNCTVCCSFLMMFCHRHKIATHLVLFFY